MESVKLALHSITEKKGRSFLTMLGIIIGVASVLILVAVVSGYSADITAYYEKLGVNKVTLSLTYRDRTNTVDISGGIIDYCHNELGEYVTGISPNITTSGTLKYFYNSNTTAKIYLGNEEFSVCGNYTIDKGREITKKDVEERSSVCVIGAYAAESLFGYIDPIDETIYYNGSPYTVVGVYYAKDGTAESSMDDMIVIPYSRNRAVMNTETVSSFTVKVGKSDDIELVMSYLELYLDDTINTNTMDYELTNGNDEMSADTEETTSLSLVLAGVASIALLVGGIGIMNIMLVTVTERTREIGIKKAIGAQRSVIVTQFLIEAAVLSATGGLIGIIIGYTGSLILGKALYDLILFPNWEVTVIVALFSILIGVIFGLYPAVKASGLQPVDALRAD